MKLRGLSNILNNLLQTGVFVLLISLVSPVSVRADTSSTFLPQFQFSATNNQPIITYTLIHKMLANSDPIPMLQVYGDGRVHAHFPEYMKNAGDYQMQLSRPELIALIRSLAQDGVLDFDHRSTSLHKEQMDTQQRSASGTLFHVSDTTETVIDIRLDSYQSSPAAKRITNFSKKFKWKNLEQDAKRYPQIPAITRAAASTQMLHSLFNRARSANN